MIPINRTTFQERMKEIVLQNMHNEQFGVSELANAFGVSRSQLLRKVKSLLHVTINEFIRDTRLEEAMKMLRANEHTAAEIAYEVGFSSPAYFNKCFHDYYGYPPGEVKKRMSEGLSLVEIGANGLLTKTQINDGSLSMEKTTIRNKRRPMNREMLGVGLALPIIILMVYWLFQKVEVPFGQNAPLIAKTIAVLPFRNDSPDKSNEYFGNGMQTEIINHLQEIGDLSVISIQSVEQFRNASDEISEIGKELKVANVLEGSMRKEGNRFRLSVQLTNAMTGFQIWSEIYEEDLDEIFAVQKNIAKSIAVVVSAEISSEEIHNMEKIPTTSVMAYDYYWRGLDEIDKYRWTQDAKYAVSGNAFFDKALEIDPKFAKAIYGKGHAYFMEFNYDSTIVYAKKAIALDPEEAAGYHLLGGYYRAIGKADLAIDNFKRAIELEPNNNWPKLMLGMTYFYKMRDIKNAVYYYNDAIRLGGRAQLDAYNYIGFMFLDMGDYERATKYFKYVLSMQEDCKGAFGYVATLYAQGKNEVVKTFLDSICQAECNMACIKLNFISAAFTDENDQAIEFFQQYIDLGGKTFSMDSICLANAYMAVGERQKAMEIVKKHQKNIENKLAKYPLLKEAKYQLAVIYAILEDKKNSMKYLSIAVGVGLRYGNSKLVSLQPAFAKYGEDPEFKAIIQKAMDIEADLQAQVQELERNGEMPL